jgi:hypothetical protein
MNEQLVKRLKSFGWRLGAMIAAAVIVFVTDNAVDLQVPVWGTTLLGLALGEITKYLNKPA